MKTAAANGTCDHRTNNRDSIFIEWFGLKTIAKVNQKIIKKMISLKPEGR